MRLHPHVAGLYPVLDPDWRRKIFHGGWLLLVAPPFGWPAVLGYRKALVGHLFGDAPAALPEWEGRRLEHFVEGLKAMGVIFGYFAPLYLALGALVASRGWTPGPAAGWALLFFAAFPIFSTLSFPTACVGLAVGSWISPGECAGFLAAFAIVTFLLPAGFLRVSRSGRYRSAFAFHRTMPFALRNLRLYLSAWWRSGLMSLAGHLAIPLSPWGVAWCYLGIIFVFNEILLRAGEAPGRGWMERALADPSLERTGARMRRVTDAGGEPVRVLDLGAFSVPLPFLR